MSRGVCHVLAQKQGVEIRKSSLCFFSSTMFFFFFFGSGLCG